MTGWKQPQGFGWRKGKDRDPEAKLHPEAWGLHIPGPSVSRCPAKDAHSLSPFITRPGRSRPHSEPPVTHACHLPVGPHVRGLGLPGREHIRHPRRCVCGSSCCSLGPEAPSTSLVCFVAINLRNVSTWTCQKRRRLFLLECLRFYFVSPRSPLQRL